MSKKSTDVTHNGDLLISSRSAESGAACDKLWIALRARPGATTWELAVAAQVGKSTAGKILAAWNREDRVTRVCDISSGGRRGADHWHAALDDSGHQIETAQRVCVEDDSIDAVTPMPADASARNVEADTCNHVLPSPVPSVQERLPKGALDGLVEDFLTERRGRSYGPGDMGKVLGRSSGAIANALTRLCCRGVVTLENDHPRRYAIAELDARAS